MKRFTLNNNGVILILVFIIMTTLCAVTVAFLYMTSVQTKGTGYDITSAKALWIAEAGVQQVMYKLKNDSNYRNNPTSVNGNLGDGAYSVTVTPNGNDYNLVSLGAVGPLARKISCSVTGGGSTLLYAAFGKSGVTLSTQSRTDSYNSSLGGYNVSGNIGHQGHVGTNSNISVSGNSYIDGNVSTGPSGNFNDQNSVYGLITHNNNVTLSAVTVPVALTGLSSSGTIDTTRTINPGNYKYTAISLGSSKALTIVGPANIYLSANTAISLTNSARIIVSSSSSGPVIIYTNGSASIGGSGVVNDTLLPANFQFYEASSRAISIPSSAAFYGMIYAPDANLSLNGQGHLYGAFIGKNVTINKTKIHYDTALSGLSIGSVGSGTISMRNWHEVFPAM